MSRMDRYVCEHGFMRTPEDRQETCEREDQFVYAVMSMLDATPSCNAHANGYAPQRHPSQNILVSPPSRYADANR